MMNSMCAATVRSLAVTLLLRAPTLLSSNAQSCHLRHQCLFAYQALHLLPPPPLYSRSVHSRQQKEPVFSNLPSAITDAMSKGWSFDSLTASLGSVELTRPVVERLLLHLKEPNDAKKALTFFHWSSRTRRFEHDLRSYCLIVHILVRAGLLVDARALLESAIRQCSEDVGSADSSVVEVLLDTFEAVLPGRRVFDLLLQTYSKMRMVGEAFDACRYLGDRGFDASLISFNTMLRVAQRSDRHDLAWKVFEYMWVRRIYPNQTTTQVMVDVMCKEGTLAKMVGVLDRIHGKRCAPGVIVNATLAFNIMEGGKADEGITLLRRMLQKNMVFDDVAYSLIISALCKTSKLDSAYESRDEMINRGCSLNSFVYTCLIGSYSAGGSIEEAVRLMEEMLSMGLKPYDETYNHLIVGLSRAGRTEECMEYCENMLGDGFLPSCRACNEILSRLCKAGEVEEANRILTSLLDKGLVPNREMYLNLIDGYGDIGNAQEILKLYYEMEHKGLELAPVVYASLVRNLCRCGKANEAEKVFKVVGRKALVSTSCMYDSLITGYCDKGDIQRALLFYDEMIRKELVPCSDTFMRLVKQTLNTEH